MNGVRWRRRKGRIGVEKCREEIGNGNKGQTRKKNKGRREK